MGLAKTGVPAKRNVRASKLLLCVHLINLRGSATATAKAKSGSAAALYRARFPRCAVPTVSLVLGVDELKELHSSRQH